ncbi:sensor histidine kinase [Paenibacillus sp. NPDC058071]|uniref:sensor histidine kinase n=1 Tax=Paenibacillus sp. NPDC058071 TaxID=3346326 RepID=UPI0036DBC05E
MKRHSVVFKLFLVTSILIVVLFAVVMVMGGLFFDRYYRIAKSDRLEQSVQELADQYKSVLSDEHKTATLVGTFMNKNDASLAIFNREFERISIEPYFIQLQSHSKTVKILLSSEGTMLGDVPAVLRTGDKLVVDGFFMDEKDTIMQPAKLQPTTAEPEEGLTRVSGIISDLLLPENRSFNPYYQDSQLQRAFNSWYQRMAEGEVSLQKGEPLSGEWTDEWSGIRYAVTAVFLPEAGKNGRYVYAMTSLQPVGEAVHMLSQYFIYLAPAILVLVTLLSLLYSRIVSAPLVKLSQTAKRMAELDFRQHTLLQSKDEFGDLSRSLHMLSENLNATLNQLTQANEELQEEMVRKERSEQLRKELIANISHELKTPLGIVKGFAEGLQDDVARDKRERYLQHIVNETDRMNALIMDMLELSKFEAKAIRLQLEVIMPGRLVRNVAATFDQELHSKGLRIHIREQEEWLAKADPRRMEQVMINFLSNAVRHAAEDSTIYIDIAQSSPGIITIGIENEGPSLAADDLSRIWDQFYRVERSRDRKTGGTGLGLAIVKNILDLHGSRYSAANTEKGVAFYFTLEQASPTILTEES